MDHAFLAPSASGRWIICTPSPRLAASFEDTESDAAREGTLAHSIAEALLDAYKVHDLAKLSLAEWKYFKGEEFYNEAMLEYCENFAQYVLSFYKEGDLLLVEQKVNLNGWIPESFGHTDANILQIKEKHLHIFDYKFGKGVPVFAEENTQLKSYALGVVDELAFLGYEIEKVTLHIYQPRIANNSTFLILMPDLLYWGRKILKPKAKMAFAGEGELVAGNHCQFCPVKSCRALAEYNLELARHDFSNPDLLEPAEIVEILERKKIFESWIKSISEYALLQALNGKKYPGYKLVEGRSDREYVNEEKVIRILSSKLTPKQLASIYKPKTIQGLTELTKILGTEVFNAYVAPLLKKPPGAPTLVSEEDSRPVYNPAVSDFKDQWVDLDELDYDNL